MESAVPPKDESARVGDRPHIERIFPFWTNLLFGLVFAGMTVTICLLSPQREKADFEVVYWILLGVLIVVGLFWIALSHLALRLDKAGITVRMGAFGLRRPWSAVVGVRRDERRRDFYGGWGVRGRRIEGKWVQAFITAQTRLVLELDDPDYRELVFSTRRPERVMEVIAGYTKPFE